MTIHELADKIEQLEKISTEATGMQAARLRQTIDNLETKRVEILTQGLINMNVNMTQQDIDGWDTIRYTFEQERENIANLSSSIESAINLGKKLLSQLT